MAFRNDDPIFATATKTLAKKVEAKNESSMISMPKPLPRKRFPSAWYLVQGRVTRRSWHATPTVPTADERRSP